MPCGALYDSDSAIAAHIGDNTLAGCGETLVGCVIGSIILGQSNHCGHCTDHCPF